VSYPVTSESRRTAKLKSFAPGSSRTLFRLGKSRSSSCCGSSKPYSLVRHQVLAPLASESRQAVLEHAARQELPELALDEVRQARAVAGLRHRAGRASLGDDLVEHGVLGVAGPVGPSPEGHGSQVRSRRRLGQC